jgi:hypothetical protein
LSKNAVQGTRREIVGHFARHSNFAGFGWVSELPVTALLSYFAPPILFQQSDDIPYLHVTSVAI